MSDRIDELRSLAQLLDDGKISESEFDALKNEVIEDSSDRPPPIEEAVKAAREAPLESDSPAVARLNEAFLYTVKVPHTYLIAFSAGIIALLLGWRMWPLPWLAVILGAMALVIEKDPHGRWMVLVGLGLGAVVAATMILTGSGETTLEEKQATAIRQVEPPPPSGESLGIRFGTLRDQWNGLESPPLITSEIRPTPEAGALDSFLHRFDGSSVLAGAYDPTDESVYALLARTDVRHEAAAGMYLHLCQLLHPGSQDCLTAFIEENNLFGKSFDALTDASHDHSWTLQDEEWRLTVSDNEATIRVQRRDFAG